MHKYHAQPTVVDGVRFASKGEAKRYGELKLLERAGKIRALKLQPRFRLQGPFVAPNGQKMRAIDYIADFQYYEGDQMVVEDVKGAQTPVFKIKWKLFLNKYPDIDARIVKLR